LTLIETIITVAAVRVEREMGVRRVYLRQSSWGDAL
jgi:hypothetical protein